MVVSVESDQEEGEVTSCSKYSDINQNLTVSYSICLESQKQSSDNTIGVKIEDYNAFLRTLKETGQTLRSDRAQPTISKKPSWFSETLFENAKSVYERHFMGVNFAHLSGLLLLVRVDSIYRTLCATGQSDTVSKLFKRYYHTVRHVKTWYEGDIFDESSEAYRSLLIVRGMHNKVSAKFNNCGQLNNNMVDNVTDTTNRQQELPALVRPVGDANEAMKTMSTIMKQGVHSGDGELRQMHVSQYDIMITQFAFIGFIVTRAKYIGLIDDFSSHDLESMLHFWRVIGYYLGASDKFNLCAYKSEDIVGLCKAITEIEYKDSLARTRLDDPPGIMSINIVRSIKFIPMLTAYGIMRYLYEILEFDISELKQRETYYSKLSYTLMKLVMSRLLAYKALRVFNNGLTRLSVYLVGKIENWFSGHLDSKYGQELKI